MSKPQKFLKALYNAQEIIGTAFPSCKYKLQINYDAEGVFDAVFIISCDWTNAELRESLKELIDKFCEDSSDAKQLRYITFCPMRGIKL